MLTIEVKAASKMQPKSSSLCIQQEDAGMTACHVVTEPVSMAKVAKMRMMVFISVGLSCIRRVWPARCGGF